MENMQTAMTTEQKVIQAIGSAETNQDKRDFQRFSSIDEPLPESTCLFCGKELEYAKLTSAFNFTVFIREYCTCAKSLEYWIEYTKLKEQFNEEFHDQCKQARAEEIINSLIKKSRIGVKFINRTFDNFKTTPQNKAAYTRTLEYAKGFKKLKGEDKGNGLTLVGNVGTGKTHLAASIANYIIRNHNIKLVFGNVTGLLAEIKATYNKDSDISEMKLLKELKETPLLIIDDLGKEKTSDWTNEVLYLIINYRYENLLPMIITSNLRLEELGSKMGEATISRVLEVNRTIGFNSKDYRTEKRNFGR